MAVQSVGAVLQTLFLLGHESGLGSCWMAAPCTVPTWCGMPSTCPEHQPQALVLMGYPASAARFRATKRG
jgi:nitroreductase